MTRDVPILNTDNLKRYNLIGIIPQNKEVVIVMSDCG